MGGFVRDARLGAGGGSSAVLLSSGRTSRMVGILDGCVMEV